MSHRDTIAARATGAGAAAVAMIRLSGPESRAIAEALCGRSLPEPHRLALRALRDASGETIDRGLVVHMPAPHSYTGQDVVELQVHGSPVVVQAVLERLYGLGARPAGPGEFTERAFLNGRLDLAQAEGVADLIAAASLGEAKAAQRQLEGQLSRRITDALEPLEKIVSDWRAALDFPEYPTDAGADRAREAVLNEVQRGLEALLASARVRARGARSVVVCGAPNAGKSTLVNAWAGEKRVLVHDQPGTTRDPVEVTLGDGAVRWSVWDTAGLRDAPDAVEAEGIEMAWARIRDADVALWLVAASAPVWPPSGWEGWVALSRIDEVSSEVLNGLRAEAALRGFSEVPVVSAREGEGLSALRAAVDMALAGEGDALVGRERHVEALRDAADAVRATLDGLRSGITLDVLTAELERAVHALGRVLGRDVELEILDRIFRDFCIGK